MRYSKVSFSTQFIRLFIAPGLLMQMLLLCFLGALMAMAFLSAKVWPIALLVLSLSLSSLDSSMKLSWLKGWCFGFALCFCQLILLSPFAFSLYPQKMQAFFLLIFYVLGVLPFFFWLIFFLYQKLKRNHSVIFNALLLWPACWLFGEYLRAHLFGGFPYLLLGFLSINTPFQVFIPYLGPFGMVFVLAQVGGAIYLLFIANNFNAKRAKVVGLGYFLCLTFVIIFLNYRNVNWVLPIGKPIHMVAVQGNIAASNISADYAIKTYAQLSVPYLSLGVPLVIWPESAMEFDLAKATGVMNEFNDYAEQHGSSLLIGTQRKDGKKDHALALLLGKYHGAYEKKRVLPLIDYVASNQAEKPLHFRHYECNTLICYEIFYSDSVRRNLANNAWMLLLANDTDFSETAEPWQQLQAARFFAKAVGRQLLSTTNNGITAWVDQKGVVKASLPPYQKGTLLAAIQPYAGMTPWGIYGDLPFLCFALGIIFFALVFSREYG